MTRSVLSAAVAICALTVVSADTAYASSCPNTLTGEGSAWNQTGCNTAGTAGCYYEGSGGGGSGDEYLELEENRVYYRFNMDAQGNWVRDSSRSWTWAQCGL